MRPQEFYQTHLEAVSRSFALCIPQLDSPFGPQVALSYLLFRVLDTVEDVTFPDARVQQRQFRAFREFLARPPAPAEVEAFRASFPDGLTEGERHLLADTGALFDDYHHLPHAARAILSSAMDRMAQGMAGYARRPAPLRLLDLEDVSRYCCFVAGVVGELLTRLWALGGDTPPAMPLAYHFGLFLQKVNILKDQAEDEASGRFFVPDRRELLASLRLDADRALAYLTALPVRERGYRIFCAWSLMLGASSLAQLDAPRESRRAQTLALLERTAEIAQDDAALRRQFAALMPPLPRVPLRPPVPKPESAEWFVRMLDAPLSADELAELCAVRSPAADVAVLQ